MEQEREDLPQADPGKLIKVKLPQNALQRGHLDRSHGMHDAHDMGSTPTEMEDRAGMSSSSRSSSQANMADLIDNINQRKIGERRSRRAQQDDQHTVCLVDEDSGRIKWIQPSGPRKPGEGIQDEEQGIVSAEATPSGGALLRITLLASGFVIGPAGQSVRDICKKTGADIKSWTDNTSGGRPSRMYVIEGRNRAVMLALTIVADAVDRYKELCEGSYCGESVSRMQSVHGIDFSYQPPPRNVVPFAAALKGQGSGMSRTSGTGRSTLSPGRKPETVLYASQILQNVRTCRVAASSSYNSRASTKTGQQQQQQQQQQPHTPPRSSHLRPRGSRQLAQLPGGMPARAPSPLHKFIRSRRSADPRFMLDDPEAPEYSDSQNSQDTEQDWPPGYAPPSSARHFRHGQRRLMHQPEHEQADELERYFSPPGYAYAPHETADLPLESTRRYDPRMQAPPQHEQSMGYHQPPGASSGSSRSRLSAPAPCLYYPSSPDHPQYAGHPEQHYAPDRSQGMQVSSPYWPATHSRPQAVPADRLPSRLSYYQPSEYCYAPPQPAEPWSWPQHAHSGGQADPGARSTPASERSNSGRASSKLPHMQPAIPASYERRASQPKQDPRTQELWLDQIYQQASAETSPCFKTPQRSGRSGEPGISGLPVTPPLAFQQSPDHLGAWRVRQQDLSYRTQSKDFYATQPDVSGTASPVSMRALSSHPQGKASPPLPASLLSAKSAAMSPDDEEGAADSDDSMKIPSHATGSTCTAPAWVCGSHPLFL